MFNSKLSKYILISLILTVVFGLAVYFSFLVFNFYKSIKSDIVVLKIDDYELKKSIFESKLFKNKKGFLNKSLYAFNLQEIIKGHVINELAEKYEIFISYLDLEYSFQQKYQMNFESIREKYGEVRFLEIKKSFQIEFISQKLSEIILKNYTPSEVEKEFVNKFEIEDKEFFKNAFYLQWFSNKVKEKNIYLSEKYYEFLPQTAIICGKVSIDNVLTYKMILNLLQQYGFLLNKFSPYKIVKTLFFFIKKEITMLNYALESESISKMIEKYDVEIQLSMAYKLVEKYIVSKHEIDDNQILKFYNENPEFSERTIIANYAELEIVASNKDKQLAFNKAQSYFNSEEINDISLDNDGFFSNEEFLKLFELELKEDEYKILNKNSDYYVVYRNNNEYKYKFFETQISEETQKDFNLFIEYLKNSEYFDNVEGFEESVSDSVYFKNFNKEKKVLEKDLIFSELKELNIKEFFNIKIDNKFYFGWKISQNLEKKIIEYNDRKEKIRSQLINEYKEKNLKEISEKYEIEILDQELKEIVD